MAKQTIGKIQIGTMCRHWRFRWPNDDKNGIDAVLCICRQYATWPHFYSLAMLSWVQPRWDFSFSTAFAESLPPLEIAHIQRRLKIMSKWKLSRDPTHLPTKVVFTFYYFSRRFMGYQTINIWTEMRTHTPIDAVPTWFSIWTEFVFIHVCINIMGNGSSTGMPK